LECYHAGTQVNVADLTLEEDRWPQFVPAAKAAGFASVHAIPMRLPAVLLVAPRHLGTLGLFGTSVGTLNDDDLTLAQALAHVASVAIVASNSVTDKETVVGQLQTPSIVA
jgi:GAF domain-containing protein